ncbi:MAG TPA: sulfotransferase [Rubrobacteraceae bacterium]|nr:sulfotransferase [Rubrobacteraceae bacterium]
MASAPVKVLYVVGLGRSGSTILSNSLGQIPGFFSGGELNFIWRHNVIENRLCGCGRPFRECPVWTKVMDEAYGGMDGVDPREMMRLQNLGTRTRHIPSMLTEKGRRTLAERLEKLLISYGRLYEAIGEVTGSRVIVDSSKEPAHGFAMGMVPGVDFYALHLVRDPRAAAYSWSKKKPQPDTDTREHMVRFSPTKSSALWDSWNASAEALWRRTPERYLRIRYEDFVSAPRESFEKILRLVGEADAEPPLVGEREVKLGVSHTVSGNPNRFETGAVELRPDREWISKMSPRNKALVTALTLPLLKHYGY